MTDSKKRLIRDVGVACALIGAALFALLIQSGPQRKPTGEREKARWEAEPGIAKTPVLKRPQPGIEGSRTSSHPRSDEPPLEQQEDAQQKGFVEDPAAVLALAQAEDLRWQEEARKETEALSRYALLLPADDAEVFLFLVGKLAWASELGLNRPEDLEGLFFNRVFFAAGRWGEKSEFPRAWIYLLRAAGCEIDPSVEQSVARLADDLFRRGLAETQTTETDIFGSPLEGGDAEYWKARGYPSLADCEVAWELRNESCSALYSEFVQRLGSLLPQRDYQTLRDFLDLFNLST